MVLKCKIKEELIKKQKTLYWLEKRTLVSYNTLNNYEKNRAKRYDAVVLTKICVALECDISDILQFEKEN